MTNFIKYVSRKYIDKILRYPGNKITYEENFLILLFFEWQKIVHFSSALNAQSYLIPI